MSYLKYKTPTPQEALAAPSEVAKYRHLYVEYCGGCGVDLGSQGAPSFPWQLSVDLEEKKFLEYSGGNPPKGPIHIRADVTKNLPFDSDCFDHVVISHVVEDFPQSEWPRLFTEYCRILKHGGHFVCVVPDHERWWAYINAGGVHNFAHVQPQPSRGDMTRVLESIGMKVLFEMYCDVYPGDYSMLAVAVKP